MGGEGWGGTSDGGEELGLGEVEADAVGAAEAVEWLVYIVTSYIYIYTYKPARAPLVAYPPLKNPALMTSPNDR
jgi:hypothetical protein